MINKDKRDLAANACIDAIAALAKSVVVDIEAGKDPAIACAAARDLGDAVKGMAAA